MICCCASAFRLRGFPPDDNFPRRDVPAAARTPESSIFELIRVDLARAVRANQGTSTSLAAYVRECFNPGTQAILAHRFGAWARRGRIPVVRHALIALHFAVEYLFAWRAGFLIPVRAEIGPGIVIHTWAGGAVLPSCRIGRNLTIVGGGVQFDHDTESVGDDCWIGTGTKFVGKIRIGDRVRTAPNAVVQSDVPDDSLAFGNPARIIAARKWTFARTGASQERANAARRAAEAARDPDPTP
jgi:serine O-acetyltransferase